MPRMDLESIWQAVRERSWPAAPPDLGAWALLILLGGAMLVAVPPLWRVARLAITVVHELGHAVIGILVGRRFTGFVVNGDMSGHAVTVGKRRGFGRAVSAWAGYPAPAVLGAALVQVSSSGWAGTALAAGLVVLALSLPFVRSGHTLAVVAGALAVLGAVWWFAGPTGAATLCLGAGVLLLLGAWRHLGAVTRGGRRKDDPQQLAELTGLPAWLWNLTFAVVIAGASWRAWRAIADGGLLEGLW